MSYPKHDFGLRVCRALIIFPLYTFSCSWLHLDGDVSGFVSGFLLWKFTWR